MNQDLDLSKVKTIERPYSKFQEKIFQRAIFFALGFIRNDILNCESPPQEFLDFAALINEVIARNRKYVATNFYDDFFKHHYDRLESTMTKDLHKSYESLVQYVKSVMKITNSRVDSKYVFGKGVSKLTKTKIGSTDQRFFFENKTRTCEFDVDLLKRANEIMNWVPDFESISAGFSDEYFPLKMVLPSPELPYTDFSLVPGDNEHFYLKYNIPNPGKIDIYKHDYYPYDDDIVIDAMFNFS